jgi:hypothetical protein
MLGPVTGISRLSALLAAAAVPSASFAWGCGDDCADAGCVPAVFLDGSVAAGSSAGLSIRACFNDVCESAELELGEAERCARLSLSSDSRICVGPEAQGRRRVSLEIHSIGGELAFQDGDRVALHVADRGGQSLAEVDQTVTYSDVVPNGTGCGRACRAAQLGF